MCRKERNDLARKREGLRESEMMHILEKGRKRMKERATQSSAKGEMRKRERGMRKREIGEREKGRMGNMKKKKKE